MTLSVFRTQDGEEIEVERVVNSSGVEMPGNTNEYQQGEKLKNETNVEEDTADFGSKEEAFEDNARSLGDEAE